MEAIQNMIDPRTIPEEILLRTPLVMDLTNSLISDVKLPYIEHDKILMSPGLWKGMNYTKEEIIKAVNNTNWSDRHVRSLFMEHADNNASMWVGEVENEHMDSIGNLRGDLKISHPIHAMTMAVGKPKFGISPRVAGEADGNNMHDFRFENFSIVINPAVKTAYINNSEDDNTNDIIIDNAEVSAMEAKRKELGVGVAEFYAVPRDPPSESKLPIFDAAHVRNALARFNQVQGISPGERSTAMNKIHSAAKKFNIETSTKNTEGNIMETEKNVETLGNQTKEAQADIKPVEQSNSTEDKTLSAWTAFMGKYHNDNPTASFEDIAKAYNTHSELSQQGFTDEEITILNQAEAIKKKKVTPPVAKETMPAAGATCSDTSKMSEVEKVVQKMSEEIVELKTKIEDYNKPEKVTLKGSVQSEPIDADTAFLGYLQKFHGGI